MTDFDQWKAVITVATRLQLLFELIKEMCIKAMLAFENCRKMEEICT